MKQVILTVAIILSLTSTGFTFSQVGGMSNSSFPTVELSLAS